jgi:hypothetical protein
VCASQRDKAKEAAVKEGVHTIENAVLSYAVDHDGAYPAPEYVTCTPSDRTAVDLGNRYLDTWPRNPWTSKPMANTGAAILFNTDFGSMAGLNVLQGGWQIVNGVPVPVGSGEHRVGFGDTGWTDVQIDVIATLSSVRGYGVCFRANGQLSLSSSERGATVVTATFVSRPPRTGPSGPPAHHIRTALPGLCLSGLFASAPPPATVAG